MPARWLAALLLSFLLQGAPGERWNVVLISIDTLRADHLGGYGYRPSVSPAIDGLAREGAQFEHAYTPVPLTLPAHTSLLTGQYPNRHGVHDNGETLGAATQTLAEAFAAGRYDTAAFIGSFILDRRFGLSRGFQEYSGNFDLHAHAGDDPGNVQIRGDQVEKEAEEWLRKPHGRPFFLFVHFYDLHGPFLLPSPWRERYPHRLYDGELAYVDSLIGRLWSSLRNAGLASKTVLVITADHGEGLGEHGESNHGFFVYHSTTRIPLIVRLPNGLGAGKRIVPVVRLIDVGPTLLAAAGVSGLRGADGVSLLGAISMPDAKLILDAYSETVYPFRHFHTAPLMALTAGSYSFIEAPRQELYDDQQQVHNILSQKPEIARNLSQNLRPFAEPLRNAMTLPVAPDVLAKLKSLGYLGGSAVATGKLADPKDRIKLFGEYQSALTAKEAGHVEQGIAGLERILSVDPAIVGARIELGLARQGLHQDEAAVKDFKAALAVDPGNALAHYNLGISLGNLHNDQGAIREFDLAVSLSPSFSRAFVGRGLAEARLGKLAEASGSLTAALAIDPNDIDALSNRGSLLGALGRWEECRRDLTKATEIAPENAAVHVALGTLDLNLKDTKGALREYERAVALDPRSSTAHSGLGFVYRSLGETSKATAELAKALELDPNNIDARAALGRR